MSKPFKLDKEFAEKWKELLLSGKYDQGRGYLAVLKDEDEFFNSDKDTIQDCEFCCLGVAAFVNGDESLLPAIVDVEAPQYTDGYGHNWPDEIRTVEHTNFAAILASLNDGAAGHVIENYQKMYPNIRFHKVPSESELPVQYSFEDIVKFLDENVEYI